jgi:hypothetical protein
VYLTTYRRPQFLARSMQSLMEACDSSPFRHRITVLVDSIDRETLDALDPYLERIFLVTTPVRLGLPFMYNLMLEHSEALIARSEESPRFVCYLQDDCLIRAPKQYFATMVEVHDRVLPEVAVGYVSGFYTRLHPGFELTSLNGVSVLKSDSLDGKNFMGTPERFRSVGRLPWYFVNGTRRGNPGPKYASGFDMWQWKESPNSMMAQRRISLIIPGLIESMARSAAESTWDNAGDQPEEIEERLRDGRAFVTRGSYPTLDDAHFFNAGD